MVGTQKFDFANAVLCWYDRFGRKNLPWQKNPTPYRVWVSEIMLQQTQVATVVGYFDRFMQRFPTLPDLACAPLDDVLALWSGLGYYARGRNLHKAAQITLQEYNGEPPDNIEQLTALPGIGRSTAGAILSLACGQRQAILDGNVKRVLSRCFAIEGWYGTTATAKELWEHAERLTPHTRVDHYTQAMMDLGATLCTRSKPACPDCPLRSECQALKQGRTDELPHRKPKKTLPVRQCRMLLIQNDRHEILLEKRPPTGIWGGMFGLPVLDNSDELERWCQTRFDGVEVIDEWPVYRHTFSHFHLDITPVHCRIQNTAAGIMEGDQQVWYKEGRSPGGLPAPVSRLLNTLLSKQNTGV